MLEIQTQGNQHLEPVAFRTLVRPLARMPANVLLQVADFPERRVTGAALVRPGHADALVQLFLLRLHLHHADFITGAADDERFLQHYLRYQAFRLRRYLGLLSRVTLHVILQDRARTERLVAYVALVQFRV